MLIVGEENVTEALEELAVKGFCFHGSSRKIEEKLVPQLASDENKESGNRKAVSLRLSVVVLMWVSGKTFVT
ncbi:MAG: hypothetical protein UW80_C0026G0003 [Microgenomates group bacterium GW2011_GWC1_44_9]|nr:MAG: hypothetical protein UW80_C0026G0003 [Microgenomates group bacterium GW2011_GWC1_44_9]